MNIKTAEKKYEDVIALPKRKIKIKKPNILFRTLLKIVSMPELKETDFTCNKIGMEKLGKREPCLFLMNHSSFIDLKIAESVLYPRPLSIICTYDGFVGKNWLMRNLGCVPTSKFVFDLSLVRSIKHCLTKLKTSVLMYPEAGYTFDGTSTALPSDLGKFIKLMGVPVVMITSHGAFARQPLYNNLLKRRVKISADMEYLLSPEQINEMSADELQRIIEKCFDFDNFLDQRESGIRINEPYRADGLNRVLYKCRECGAEGEMLGRDTVLKCEKCGCEYELTESGVMYSQKKDEFVHIPDWYEWQREQVKRQILDGTYAFCEDVDIYMLVDTKSLYKVGDGTLKHSKDGFELCGCDGRLHYIQKPLASYTLNSDFYWYEMGDVISIGNQDALYYCFPKTERDVVTKARLATEEIYKLANKHRAIEKAGV